MPFLQEVLKFLDFRWSQLGMEVPTMFGAFHIISLIAMVAITVLLCVLWNKGIIKNVRNVVLVTAIIVLVFEIYKQINFSFSYQDGIKFNYQWYIFPWQFCSTPLYIGLMAGLSKGKIHDHFCSYLSTYAFFAGLAVMIYTGDVFIDTIGICVQTMICHGSMVVIAVFLFYTGYVDTGWNTLLKALPIFTMNLSIAVGLNELFHNVIKPLVRPDFMEEGRDITFNMFYVGRYKYWEWNNIPVYSSIHNAILDMNENLYPLCILIYIVGFTAVAAIMLLLVRTVERILTTDYELQYIEADERRRIRQAERKERLKVLEAERKERAIENREKNKQRKQEEKERRAEEREERRNERRNEKQKERARRKAEKKKQRKAKRKARKKELQERLAEKRREKKKERQEEKRLKERMKKIEREEKEREKRERKLEKEEKKRKKEEKKALKKWIKNQKKMGNDDPDIEDFYDWYYD